MSHDDLITTGKDFAGFATELLDSEVQQAVAVIVSVQEQYKHRANTAANLEMLRDETLERLAAIGILATLDPTPCFYGEPPVLEILGKVKGDSIHKEGFDHEKKGYEVRKSVQRGEDFLGQKERVNPRRPKK